VNASALKLTYPLPHTSVSQKSSNFVMLEVNQTQLCMSISVCEMEPVLALCCLVFNLYEKRYHAKYVLRRLVLECTFEATHNAGNM